MMRFLSVSFFILLVVQSAFAQRKYNRTSSDPMQIYMVPVLGGSFDLGSDNEATDRKPAHTVKLKDYYLSAYEVTQRQWRSIMGTNPSSYQCDDCPVTNVSWKDAREFIGKLNKQTGKHYRLPTEAEWEYAARGGEKEELVRPYMRRDVDELMVAQSNKEKRMPDKVKAGKRFAGQQLPGEIAWFARNSGNHVHPVGFKKPNALGLYDMSGNVEEWCADWYAPTYGGKNAVENPQGPSSGRSHVVRGGGFDSSPAELHVTRRAAYLPDTKANSLGFRLAEDK